MDLGPRLLQVDFKQLELVSRGDVGVKATGWQGRHQEADSVHSGKTSCRIQLLPQEETAATVTKEHLWVMLLRTTAGTGATQRILSPFDRSQHTGIADTDSAPAHSRVCLFKPIHFTIMCLFLFQLIFCHM